MFPFFIAVIRANSDSTVERCKDSTIGVDEINVFKFGSIRLFAGHLKKRGMKPTVEDLDNAKTTIAIEIGKISVFVCNRVM